MVSNKKKLFRYLRIFVSVILVGYLIYSVNWYELKQILLSVKVPYVVLGLGLNFAIILINSYRWKILLSVQKGNVKFAELVNLWLVGLFFNNFFPTSLGGDSVKAYYVFQRSQKNPVAISSLILLRSMGVVSLVFLVLFAMVLSGSVMPLRVKNAVLLFVFLFCMVILLFIILVRVIRKTDIMDRSLKRIGIWAWYEKIYGSLLLFRKNKRVLFISVILALVPSIMLVLVNNVYCTALDCHLPILVFAMLIPLINFIQMLPISMNGLGIREGAYVFFFSMFGMSSSQAFSLSLLIFLSIVFFGIIGGCIYVFSKD